MDYYKTYLKTNEPKKTKKNKKRKRKKKSSKKSNPNYQRTNCHFLTSM